jgi:DNA-binding MarR family transcriptional regulator
MFSAKQIAEYAFITSRQVSGAIRKLVTDGYCEKVGQDPIIYSLTDLGKQIDVASLE